LIGGGGVAALIACGPSCDGVSVVAAAGFSVDDPVDGPGAGAVGEGGGVGSAEADGTTVIADISTETVKAMNEADLRRPM